MADTQIPQGYTYIISEAMTEQLRSSFSTVYAITQVPADFVNVPALFLYNIDDGAAPFVNISQLSTIAVIKGQVENPKMRAWGFVLDGHPFYVLRLGEEKTLLYDMSTKQWSWWSSSNRATWRPNVGINWMTPGENADTQGSNVFCGDDSRGIIWGLNPLQGWDEFAAADNLDKNLFLRRATAQMTTRNRVFIPVFDVRLTGSPGEPAYLGAAVTLSYSDDGGQSYVNAGPITVKQGDFVQEFSWTSLGRIQAPGRLFQIIDDGAFARIDGLDVYTGE